jgi:hypothetical protein
MRLTGIKACWLSVLIVISTGWLQGGTAEKPEVGDAMVELGPNDTGEIFIVSDLYAYSGSNCTGTSGSNAGRNAL